ncbi:MAG: T9SS type A sorting domain-containing protein [Candidatus Cyclobacteriaceae bacterium M2_1C_046]
MNKRVYIALSALFVFMLSYAEVNSQILKGRVDHLTSWAESGILDNKIEHTWRFIYKDNIDPTFVSSKCIAFDGDNSTVPYHNNEVHEIFTKYRLPNNFTLKLDGYENDDNSRCGYNNNSDDYYDYSIDTTRYLANYTPGIWHFITSLKTINSTYLADYWIYYSFAPPQKPAVLDLENNAALDDSPQHCAEKPLRISTLLQSPNHSNITYDWQYHIRGDQTSTWVENPYYCGTDPSCSDTGEFVIRPSCCDEPAYIEEITYHWNTFSTTTNSSLDFSVKSIINPQENLAVKFRVIAKAGDIVLSSDTTTFFSYSPASPEFVVVLDSLKDSCPLEATGKITINVTSKSIDPSAPLTLKYPSPFGVGNLTENFTGLNYVSENKLAATYNIHISNASDANSNSGTCRSEDQSVTISSYAPLEINTSVATPTSCKGASDGSANITVKGGEPGRAISYTLTHTVSKSEFTNSDGQFSGLAAGLYDLKITDYNCTPEVNTSIFIDEPETVFTDSITHQNFSCSNEPNGQINIYGVDGGLSDEAKKFNYYLLDAAGAELSSSKDNPNTSHSFSGLAVGIYKIKIEDSNRPSCTGYTSSDISITDQRLVIDSTSSTNTTCSYSSDGTITAVAAKGAGEYIYTLSGTASASNETGFFQNLSAGNYEVEVTNKSTCTDSETRSFTINKPNAISITSHTITDITCFSGSNGKVDISVSGGTGTLSYQWKKADGTSITGQTSQDLTSVVAGKYYVVITDGNNCTYTSKIFEVKQPVAALQLDPPIKTDVICHGETNGTITSVASGGWGSYRYNYRLQGALSWSSLTGTTNLAAGTYDIKVTDAKGCADSISGIIITAPDLALAASQNIVNVSCNGNNNGSITVNASGGNGTGYGTSYFYSINNGAYISDDNTYTFGGLAPGSYVVRVKDERNCVVTLPQVSITEPPLLVLSVGSIKNVECYGQSTGEVTLAASGGYGSKTYRVGSGTYQTSNIFSELAAGSYIFTVKDANNCLATTTATVTEPNAAVAISITDTTNITCNNQTNGSITASVTGGTNNLYQWQQNIGGTWQNLTGEQATSLTNRGSGSYRLKVYNSNGGSCDTYSAITNLTNPSVLSFSNVQVNHITCKGASDGSINPSVTGGWGEYRFYYSTDGSEPSILFNSSTNFSPGSYRIKVIDKEGCSLIYHNTIIITEPTDALSATLALSEYNSYQVSCSGASDGEVTVTATGGNGTPFNNTYTYSLNDGPYSISNVFSTLSAGSYSVKVKDERGCVFSITTTLNEPDPLQIAVIDSNKIICYGDSTGYIEVNASGGTAPYEYSLNGGSYQQQGGFNNLPAGAYSVVVKDANGCIDPVSVTIAGPAAPLNISLSVDDIVCYNDNNASIIASASGGWGDYIYQWQRNDSGLFVDIAGATTSSIANLGEGIYRLKLTDKYLCVLFSGPIEFINPEPLLITNVIVSQIICKGDNNGSIDPTVSGGWGNYQYEYSLDGWSSYQSFTSSSSLSPGDYAIRVRDNEGCLKYYPDVISITEPSVALSFSYDLSDYNGLHISCNGSADGSITLTPTGGNDAPFSNNYYYSIDNQPYQATNTFDNLTAGTYNVTIKDERNCTFSADITLVEPVPVNASRKRKNYIKCYGESTGYIVVDASGGVSPYQYKINNGQWQSSDSLYNLSAGKYILAVKDNNGCIDTFEENIIQPDEPISISFNVRDISCHGGNDGEVEAVVVGGMPPYSYTWDSDTSNTNILSSLEAGKYFITVTDTEGCTKVDSISLTEPEHPLTATIENTDLLCFGDSSAYIRATADGGTFPYAYSIDGGVSYQSDSLFQNLKAGRYLFRVMDNNGCHFDEEINILQPDSLYITISETSDILCNGENTGSFKIEGKGGGGNYRYSINGGNYEADSIFDQLKAGEYNISIQDGNNCSSSINLVLSEPDPLALSFEATPVTCKGDTSGIINLHPSGGVGFYNYLINNISYEDSIVEGFSGGTYALILTDTNNCQLDTVFIIAEPDHALAAIVTEQQNVSCNGLSDGEFNVSASGGYGNYLYNFDGFFQANSLIEDLPFGEYHVQVKDSMNCLFEVTTVITQPDSLILAVSDFSNLSCHNDESGFVSLSAEGGTPDYEYSNDSITFISEAYFDHLSVGNYKFFVKDSNSCIASVNQYLSEPDTLSAAVTDFTNAACGQKSGAAEVTTLGGTGAYAYLWQNWDNEIVNANAVADSLYAGKYDIYISDENNCQYQLAHTVIDEEAPELKILDIDPVSCYGYNDGSAAVYAEGGAGGYFYSWSDSLRQKDSIAYNLRSKAYSVRVTDSRGCVSALELKVGTPDPLVINIDSLIKPACFGDCDGEIKLAATGGTGDYSFKWTESKTSGSAVKNLCAGDYPVELEDDNGCETSTVIVLEDPEIIKIDSVTIDHPSCASYEDGQINIIASGGTGDLQIEWDSINTNEFNLTSLGDGNYQATIYDDNFCTIKDTITLVEPALLEIDTAFKRNASCSYSPDGAVEVTGNGGTLPYSFQWNDFPEYVQNAKYDLRQNDYKISINDSNGCSDSLTANVNAPDSLYINVIAAGDPLCVGDYNGFLEVQAVGGTSGYTYSWNFGESNPIADSLGAGEYSVLVQDNNECEFEFTTILQDPDPLDIILSAKKDASCFNDCDGELSIEGNGGTGFYTYLWDQNNSDSSFVNGLCAGQYSVKMKDSNNCEVSGSFAIDEPEKLELNLIEAINPLCSDSEDGSIKVAATGGNDNFEFYWPGLNAGVSEVTGLAKGEYLVEVKDSLNCFSDSIFILSAPSLLQIDVLATIQPECSGDCEGEIEVFAYGGTAPYIYSWEDDSTRNTSLATFLCADRYSVNVTDVNHCEEEKEILLNGPELISLIVSKNVSPLCASSCDGSLEVVAYGGTAPYSYEWLETGDKSALAEDLCAGIYTVKITDATGCIYLQEIELQAPAALDITVVNAASPVCYGFDNGYSEVLISGGTSPYHIEWNDSLRQNTALAQNLKAGEYKATVTDSNGCIDEINVIVPEAPLIAIDLGGSRTLCKDQVASLDPGIDSLTYEWTADNGFTSSNQQVGLAEEGIYYLKGTTSQGCIVRDTFEVITTEESFEVNFLAASELIAGDTLLLTEVCYPVADYLTWEFADGAEIIDPSDHQPQISYKSAGTYDISLTAWLGECYDTQTKTTIWYDPSEAPDIDGRIMLGESGIKNIRLHPNPTTGEFFVDVTLHQEAPLAVFVYDNFGKELIRISRDEGIFYRFNIDISKERSGTYHLRVVSNNDVRGLKIIKSK